MVRTVNQKILILVAVSILIFSNLVVLNRGEGSPSSPVHNSGLPRVEEILFKAYLEADPEIQLNKSTQRFIERAKYVEKNTDPNIDLETLWEEAKKSQLK